MLITDIAGSPVTTLHIATPKAPIAIPTEPEISSGLRPHFSTVNTASKVKEDIDNAHEHGLHHRIGHAHRLEYARSEIKHGIDADSLLEYAQHDTDKDNHPAVGKESFCFSSVVALISARITFA